MDLGKLFRYFFNPWLVFGAIGFGVALLIATLLLLSWTRTPAPSGIGGTAEKAMILAKEALLRPVGKPNPEHEVAELEKELLQGINALGIGPQGFGGSTTALAVHVEIFPSHMASLPVAVNLQCHSARHREAVI